MNLAMPDADVLLRCCGSQRWVESMIQRCPFHSSGELFRAADEIWNSLDRDDWLEAFAAHPRIGDVESLRTKFASTAEWCSGEQGGVAGADDKTLDALAAGNRDYEAKFGYIFIICATGRSAAEMLELLQRRLANDADTELRVAVGEQSRITRLRLEKL